MKVVVCDPSIQTLQIAIKLILGSYVKCCNVILRNVGISISSLYASFRVPNITSNSTQLSVLVLSLILSLLFLLCINLLVNPIFHVLLLCSRGDSQVCASPSLDTQISICFLSRILILTYE